jgi:hypothetical protein
MTSYVRRDDVFWLPCVAGSVRARNVRAQPWTSLVVAEGDRGEHIVVSIEGNGEIVETDDVPDDVRREAPGDWIDAWIRLQAERVLSYGATGAVR